MGGLYQRWGILLLVILRLYLWLRFCWFMVLTACLYRWFVVGFQISTWGRKRYTVCATVDSIDNLVIILYYRLLTRLVF